MTDQQKKDDEKLEPILEVAHALVSSLSIDEIQDTVRFTCYAHFRAADVHLFLNQQPVENNRILFRSRFIDILIGTEDPLYPRLFQSDPAIRTEKLSQEFQGSSVLHTLAGLGVEWIIPLKYGNQITGLLCLNEKEDGKTRYAQEEIRYITILAPFISIAVENARLYGRAIFDPKTGLNNSNHFQTVLGLEFQRARRYDHSLSVILINFDQFKKVNDVNGFLAGDEVLKRFSNLLQSQLRNSDTIARIDGDTFGILLPSTEKSEAREVADRIRRKQEREVYHGAKGNFQATVRCGVSSADFSQMDSGEDLLRRVQEALARSRKSGKNNTVDL